MFARRLHARPVIALVVEIRAVDEHIELQPGVDTQFLAARDEQSFEPGVQLGLAEVATVGRVFEIVGILEFLGFDHAMTNADLLCELLRCFPLAGRQARTDGGHSDGVFAAAFARHSYLHVLKERVPSALAELRRVLHPGALLMLSLIEGDYEGHDLPGDDFPGRYFAFWSAAELGDALTGAGFVAIGVERVPRARGEGDLLATARR